MLLLLLLFAGRRSRKETRLLFAESGRSQLFLKICRKECGNSGHMWNIPVRSRLRRKIFMTQHSDSESELSGGREARYNEFVSLLARHDQAIRRFVRSLLPSREGVDDVMQETALECWKKFSDFRPGTADQAVDEFIRWACVIARYKALSWQRDRGRDRLVFRDSVIERLADAAVENISQQNSERHAVESCLAKMAEDQRRLVLSVHSPGQSIATIAAETGQQARRLYTRVNVLRKQLLDCVQRQVAGEAAHG